MAKNEIVKQETTPQGGICRYCGQVRFVEAPEGLPPEDVNQLATDQCDCAAASRAREKKRRMQAAGAWAQGVFGNNNGQFQTVCCSIRSVFENEFDYVTIKAGKRTYKIDRDSDEMIRIKTTYRDSSMEEF